jgi:hypothetical protein
MEFWWGSLTERDKLEDVDLERKIIKIYMKEVELIDLDWVHLSKDMDKCPLMNLWIPCNVGIF